MSKTSTDQQVAQYLLQIGAVQLSPRSPFQWSSGLQAPIYCDNRKILSHPKIRTYVKEQFVEHIQQTYSTLPDVIAGVATSGIPFGTLIADQLELPFIYVRSKAKQHGKQQQIEGKVSAHQQAIVIEDLISTGKSCLQAANVLQQNEMQVLEIQAIFSYQLSVADSNFKEQGLTYQCLTNFETLIQQAAKTDQITPEEVQLLQEWRQSPRQWSQKYQ